MLLNSVVGFTLSTGKKVEIELARCCGGVCSKLKINGRYVDMFSADVPYSVNLEDPKVAAALFVCMTERVIAFVPKGEGHQERRWKEEEQDEAFLMWIQRQPIYFGSQPDPVTVSTQAKPRRTRRKDQPVSVPVTVDPDNAAVAYYKALQITK